MSNKENIPAKKLEISDPVTIEESYDLQDLIPVKIAYRDYYVVKKLPFAAFKINILRSQCMRLQELYYDPDGKQFYVTSNIPKKIKSEYPYRLIKGTHARLDHIDIPVAKMLKWVEEGRYE